MMPPLGGWVLFSVVCAAFLHASTANAGFLAHFTGWTQMANGGSAAGGVVDFAVYQNAAGHDWTVDLGLTQVLDGTNAGGGPVDHGATYIYFYEVINTHPIVGDAAIANLNIASGSPNGYTSGGWLSGTVLRDSEGAIGPARNVYLGMEQLSAPPGDPSTTLPSHSGETLAGFAAIDGALAPTGLNSLGGTNGAGAADFLWTSFFGNQLLKDGGFSPVLFVTSDLAPTYAAGMLTGTSANNPSQGGVAAEDPVAPEPATLTMWGIATVGLAVVTRRRRRGIAA